jgi:hypothetical protein
VTPAPAAAAREPFHGAGQVFRFNWPFYALGTTAVVLTPALASWTAPDTNRLLALYGAAALVSGWLLGSLVVSWVVYDRSDLMRGSWIRDALGFTPRTWIKITGGLDELTPVLRTLVAGTQGRAFDIFAPVEMTERSIGRARRSPGEWPAEPADWRLLPVVAGTVEAAVVPLSAHELRTDRARVALFDELHRVLVPDGRVIVAEHLRSLPNVLAYGPGALHFHSRRTWIRCFSHAGFALQDERPITPFVRVFVLRRLS